MGHLCWIFAVQLSLLLLCAPAPSDSSSAGILLKAPNGVPVSSFTGALYWNTRRIVVEPPIRAVIDGPDYLHVICGFQLHRRGRDTAGGDPPVEIRMRDPTRGTGQLHVREGADLSAYAAAPGKVGAPPAYFDFDISAFDCNEPMRRSDRVPVLLRVEEFEEPVFGQAAYSARMAQSAKIGAEILRVGAKEAHNSARVCRYEIGGSAEGLPFDVDGAGAIRLKAPLVPSRTEQHFALTVTASDCSVPESRKASVPVSIVAYPTVGTEEAAADEKCSMQWMGIPEKLAYAASSGVRTFAGAAALPDCRLARRRACVQSSAVVKVTVRSTAWAETCDRSVRSLYDQRRVCQMKPGSVDLLNPHYKPEAAAPSQDRPDCKCCKAAEVARLASRQHAKPLEHRSFDGVEYYMDVPAAALPDASRLGDQFTLHFWLRHGPMSGAGGAPHPKEHILCSADERGHSRHHYSVFLHNCKLILLLRREYSPGESADQLRPAEWRFRLGEVCDSEWHHYAVSYSAGRVKLDVDGKIFAHSVGNPQVLEDYPMHRTPDAATRLTIGACWHSSDSTYRQFLKGAVAGLVLLRGELESDNVIHCLNQCHEKLDFRAMSQLEPGMSVSLNADFTMIEIKGHNASEVAHLLKQIGYTNVRRNPSLGAKSSIRLDTSVTCTDPKVKVSVHPVVIDVQTMVPAAAAIVPAAAAAAAPSPSSEAGTLCISGRNLLRYEPAELASPGGVSFLEGLEIHLDGGGAADKVMMKPGKLDVCVLRTSPDFSAVESLVWPASDASDAGVEGRVSRRELILEGYATPEVYQRLLSRVAYGNANPIIGYRTFVLTCSVVGGGLVSNEFTVKLSVLHPVEPRKPVVKKQLPDPPSMSAVSSSGLRPHFAESHAASVVRGGGLRAHDDQSSDAAAAAATPTTPVAPIVIGVVTAGLLLVALGLMYLRYLRSLQGGGSGRGGGGGKTLPVDAESQAEMEWDNSALNITVNPLDNDEAGMSDSGSEGAPHDDYVEDELDLDGSSSCPEDDDDLDGMTASGLLMQRSAQIASSEDELDDEAGAVQMVTGAEAVRYGQQQQLMKQQQLEWDDSSLPQVRRSQRPPQPLVI